METKFKVGDRVTPNYTYRVFADQYNGRPATVQRLPTDYSLLYKIVIDGEVQPIYAYEQELKPYADQEFKIGDFVEAISTNQKGRRGIVAQFAAGKYKYVVRLFAVNNKAELEYVFAGDELRRLDLPIQKPVEPPKPSTWGKVYADLYSLHDEAVDASQRDALRSALAYVVNAALMGKDAEGAKQMLEDFRRGLDKHT